MPARFRRMRDSGAGWESINNRGTLVLSVFGMLFGSSRPVYFPVFAPSSADRWVAASTASMTAPRKPRCSKA